MPFLFVPTCAVLYHMELLFIYRIGLKMTLSVNTVRLHSSVSDYFQLDSYQALLFIAFFGGDCY